MCSCREKATKKSMAKSIAKEASPVQEPAVVSDDEGNDDDSTLSYERIEVLQDAGINATDIAKLKDDGFATVGQLFQVSTKRLLQVKGIIGEKSGFIAASTLLINNKQKYYITTGSKRRCAEIAKTRYDLEAKDVLDNIIVARLLSKVIDSPCMPEAECTVQLAAGGICDADE
ncbi:hypothetical protein DYB32_003532 [Aphanomyces invadans]|uniref:DNA recombination and repair protein Rad51-like C-terminal domain-containing protein n=1 Tax=Aphanomyces invadans TaxID=157072 RepID=A0A418B6A6_9STRA|nr:hypothetical protein DYB32_003532 [Aphanomyces invadans]